MNSDKQQYFNVSLPVPLRRSFSYSTSTDANIVVGLRVLVPFGARQLVGIVVEANIEADPKIKIKAIISILDSIPIADTLLAKLIKWSSDYYHHPLGEVWQAALPKRVRLAKPLDDPDLQKAYFITDDYLAGISSDALEEQLKQELSKTPAQRRIALAIAQSDGLHAEALLTLSTTWRSAVKKLSDRNIVTQRLQTKLPSIDELSSSSDLMLNEEQTSAVDTINTGLGSFQTTLLNGITGSGKTEVYFSVIDAVLAKGEQALVLFPEIALTTQLVARFKVRFGNNIAALHSGLSDAARYRAWYQARLGRVGIILGTRSAVFTGLHKPGIIILDEEHDSSFKQQEGFRYHARSIAIKRAQELNIPVVLGSATPSIETLHNVELARFQQCRLTQRAGKASLPKIDFVDLQQFPTDEGLTQPLIRAIDAHLKKQQQVLVFINRRGFSPVLFCAACQWQATCPKCDSTMTLHQGQRRLRCHHCDTTRGQPENCPSCDADALIPLGEGTQRVEEGLSKHFPDARIQRFDRDELSTHSKLETALDAVHQHEVDILVGTQLLTKGHDFPNVTLVCVVNADSGLHSIDFRAPEQLIQQLLQVAGRAGRAEKAGQVLIQTHHPQHHYFQALSHHDYTKFASLALEERRLGAMPPHSNLVLWRANSTRINESRQFLSQVAQIGRQLSTQQTEIFDAVDSPMAKRGGRYRAQLLVRSSQRRALHGLLANWLLEVEKFATNRHIRWSIDIDPIDLY